MTVSTVCPRHANTQLRLRGLSTHLDAASAKSTNRWAELTGNWTQPGSPVPLPSSVSVWFCCGHTCQLLQIGMHCIKISSKLKPAFQEGGWRTAWNSHWEKQKPSSCQDLSPGLESVNSCWGEELSSRAVEKRSQTPWADYIPCRGLRVGQGSFHEPPSMLGWTFWWCNCIWFIPTLPASNPIAQRFSTLDFDRIMILICLSSLSRVIWCVCLSVCVSLCMYLCVYAIRI